MIQVLKIDKWRPVTVNGLLRKHWAKRRKAKLADANIVWIESLAQGITKTKGRRRVSITCLRPAQETKPDPDALYKSVLDALVKAQLLVDDSVTWCEVEPVRYADAKHPGMEITLEDVPNL